MWFFNFKKKKIIDVLLLLLVILLVIPIIMPFFHKGFFPTHDDVQTARIFEMYQALRYGNFPPRWASGLLFGYGYPLFSFYPPLTYYLGALLVFVGSNFLVATKIVFLMAFFLGAIAMYLLVKEMFGRLPALVASIVFSYAPYRAVDVYVRGDLPEFLSLSLFPLVLCLNWQLLKKKNPVWLPLFSLSLTLLALTHNISLVIFAFFLVIFNLAIIFGLKEKVKILNKVIAGVTLALVMSSFFWLPLLAEVKFVNLINHPWPHSYEEYFLTYRQLWSSPWGFNGFLEPQPMSLQIGKTFIIFSLFGLLIGFFKKYDLPKKLWFLFAGFFLFSVFMTTASSNFIWKSLSFLSFFQFPWRFHLLITFCASILIATIVYFVGQIFLQKKLRKLIVVFIALVIIVLVVFENYRFFKPKFYWEPLAVFETTTWDDEYLPLWVKVKPKDYGEKVKIVEGEGEIKEINWGYLEKDFTVMAKKESVVELAHIYYPGWKAFINGKPQVIDYNNERGVMKVKVSQGEVKVTFKFTKTPLRLVSEIISLIGLLSVIFLLIDFFRKKRLLF